jgi:integrase/recombinase XerC
VCEAIRRIRRDNTYAAGTLRTYLTGWNLLHELFGDRRVDEITACDLRRALKVVQDRADERLAERNRHRRARGPAPADGATGAQENFVRAARALFTWAYDDLGLPASANPAAKLRVPTRRPSRRRALRLDELRQVFDLAAGTGNDPTLDVLLLRTGWESGARTGGLVNLRLSSLDHRRQTVMLLEKGSKRREQPVTAELLAELERFARTRGARDPDDHVFRYWSPRDGGHWRPVTDRRLDNLFERIRRESDWARQWEVSMHYVRHSVGSAIERVAGKAVARSFLGHQPTSGDTTDIYTVALPEEVAAAWCAVMHATHPLAEGPSSVG